MTKIRREMKKIINKVLGLYIGVVLLLGTVFAFININSASATEAIIDTNNTYNIHSFSRVLDVTGGSSANGARIQQYSKNYTIAQRFRFISNTDGTYTIKSIASGKVLDVPDGIAKKGASIWQYTPNNSLAQKWIILQYNDKYKIVSALDETLCLDIQNGSNASGAKLQLYDDNGTSAQRFTLSQITNPIANGLYEIRGIGSLKVLDIAGGSIANAGKIQLYTPNNTLAQKFQLSFDSYTGYYLIKNINGDKVLDVKGNSSSNGAPVHTWSYGGGSNQKWTIEPSGLGYKIVAANCGRALDAKGGGTANGTQIQIYDQNGSRAQQWQFNIANPAETGFYNIGTSFGTNLDIANRSSNINTNIQSYQRKNWELAQIFSVELVTGVGSDAKYKIVSTVRTRDNLLLGVNGTNLALLTTASIDSTLWNFLPNGKGGYHIKNLATGKVLDVAGGRANFGTNIQVYTMNHTKAQEFTLNRLSMPSDGMYNIQSLDAGKVFDVGGGSLANNAPVNIYNSNNTGAQMFYLRNVGGSNYRLTNFNSGKSVSVSNYDGNISGTIVQREIVEENNQLWRIEFANGGFRIVSVLNNGNSCITLSNISNSSPLFLNTKGAGNQGFMFVPKSVNQSNNTAIYGLFRRGIDVSVHNGSINWWAVKNSGISFAIIRAGWIGTQNNFVVDTKFEENVRNAKAAGLQIGTYIYVYSNTVSRINGALDAFHSSASVIRLQAQGYKIDDLPLYLDIEDVDGQYLGSLNYNDLTNVVLAGLSKLKNWGYRTGFYANNSWATTRFNAKHIQNQGYSFWMAAYGTNNSEYQRDEFKPMTGWKWGWDSSLQMWQYRSTGQVNGINGNVDKNYMYRW